MIKFVFNSICFVFFVLSFQNAFGLSEDFEDEINLYCLRLAYPQIEKIEKRNDETTILLKNGKKIPYSHKKDIHHPLVGSIRESMKEPYPLEPNRPDTPKGVSPGRKRPYEFMEGLYGAVPEEVRKNLSTVALRGKPVQLVHNAVRALKGSLDNLDYLAGLNNENKKFLIPEGGYYWRKIAGENFASAHSYGLALDIGVNSSPYWRWAKIQPHPLQKTYPGEIVREFEKHGFIWGGKWYEYDLMHYEYRPELICKAYLMKFLKNN